MADGKLGFGATLWAALFAPRRLFEAVRAGQVTARPVLVYAAIQGVTGTTIGLWVAELTRRPALGVALLWGTGALLLTPLSWYADAGVSHALLRLFGGKGTFRDTQAAVGFGATPLLLAFVPIVSIALQMWAIILRVYGSCRLHQLSIWRVLLATTVAPLVAGVGTAMALRVFVLEAFKVPSGSMFPSVEMGDHLFVTKGTYGAFTKSAPGRGDVVVFLYPDSTPDAPRVDYVKRVIGLPNDEVTFESGAPVINGWHVPRCRLGSAQVTMRGIPADETNQCEVFVEFLEANAYLVALDHEHDAGIQGPYRIKPGEFWVVGDNRNNSSDSRSWNRGSGAGVPFENTSGRARWLWLPPERFGIDLAGPPVLPQSLKQFEPELKRCLAEAPDLAQRTPPAPR